ncbi:MAG: ADP-ribose pyrophosphatase, partial [Endomicrobiia bacterium]
VIHIFVATNLFKGKKNPDEDEFLHTKIITFNKALQWIKKGIIKDSKSVIGILYWKMFYEKK